MTVIAIGTSEVTCPECEGIGGFPGFDVDDTAILILCELCDGQCTVSPAVAREWAREQAED